MIGRAKLLTVVLSLSFLTPSPELRATARQISARRAECFGTAEGRFPLSISFERTDDKAWAGDKYEKGVLLRVRNGSKCAILLEVPEHEVSTRKFRDGKFIDVEIAEAEDGQRFGLKYLMKYPGRESMELGGFGGHVLERVRLRGGDTVLFSVPLRNFRKGGELILPYRYEWAGSEWEEYSQFERRLLPRKVLR